MIKTVSKNSIKKPKTWFPPKTFWILFHFCFHFIHSHSIRTLAHDCTNSHHPFTLSPREICIWNEKQRKRSLIRVAESIYLHFIGCCEKKKRIEKGAQPLFASLKSNIIRLMRILRDLSAKMQTWGYFFLSSPFKRKENTHALCAFHLEFGFVPCISCCNIPLP